MSKNTVSNLLAIDPGTQWVGYAHFQTRSDRTASLLNSGYIHVSTKGADWIERIDLICRRVVSICFEMKVNSTCGTSTKVLIELPMNFGGTGRGAAALNSGAVGKLLSCVFQIKGAISQRFPEISVDLIPVRVWKGNLPKAVTERRIMKYWGVKGKVDDESDAIGIGTHFIMNVLKYKPLKQEH